MTDPSSTHVVSTSPTWRIVSESVLVYVLSLLLVLGGMAVMPQDTLPAAVDNVPFPTWASRFFQWDAVHYLAISCDGYSYHPRQASTVAFFPLYPLVGHCLGRSTGLGYATAILTTAHVCLLAAFIVFGFYAHARFPTSARSARYAILAFGLFPTTLFFRMAYSESLFLLLAILALYGMEQKWRLDAIALCVGLATASRPVGVVLLLPFAWNVWQERRSIRDFIPRVTCLAPLACCGLLAYMIFLHVTFGDSFAFVETQHYYRLRPPEPLNQKLIALATLEPIWSVYVPSSPAFWRRFGTSPNAILSLYFANPFYFVAAASLILVGWRNHWLTRYETLLSVGLLVMPYLTRSFEMCMGSHGRFAAAVFPVYLVLGNLFSRWRPTVVASILTLSAAFLFLYAALSAADYPIY